MEEQNPNFFKQYREKIEGYLEDRLMLLRLKSVKKISTLIVQMVGMAFLALLSGFIVLFISIMLGFYLGHLLDSYYAGFGIVTLLFVLTFIFSIVYRKKLMRKVISSIIDTVLDKKEDDD
ncbi:hypothetical protein GCM10027566_37220 [Arachidicoccus ginsenosidivorans]|jgi:hypothetical protein|uniref:SoxR reducing system RseC family protein n=1 Tax=Arachidicoccus ginsenosidivorans TaxID=496057 RepID=A0A5B8VLF4_9BACT|nr:SoxR reducing system RseC family protein [Arachidicoccus ginsenosidivorans]QEC72340.1 SoxR reducing system RseC family protein [Arachidicoccus ginsenosidivorans]